MVFNPWVRGRYELIIRISFAFTYFSLSSFNDPLITIIMRFFTFVALMLPLSALAAPTSTPPQPAPNDLTKKLNDAREQFSAALGETSLAVNKTIAQLEKDPKQGALLTKAKAVNDQLEIAFIAAQTIQNAIQATTPVQEPEYVDNLTTNLS